MKKAFSIVYKLLVVSLLFQVVLYFLADSYILGSRQNIAGRLNVIPVSVSEDNKDETAVNIPKAASAIQVSYDLAYASYIVDGKLEIIDMKSNKLIKRIINSFPEKDGTPGSGKNPADITCCRWLPDKNILMYALCAKNDSSGRMQLCTYDASTANEHVGANLVGAGIPKGSEAVDLIISPLNMVTYVKVKTGSTKARMYRIDIMDHITEPFTIDLESSVKTGYYSENLIYRTKDGNLFIRNGTGAAGQIPFKGKAALLDIVGSSSDGKDQIYLGELDNSRKVTGILHGIPGTSISKWSKIAIKQPVSEENLLVRQDGMIYEISENESTLTRLTDGKKCTFTGKFIDFKNGQVVTVEKNLLRSKAFN